MGGRCNENDGVGGGVTGSSVWAAVVEEKITLGVVTQKISNGDMEFLEREKCCKRR